VRLAVVSDIHGNLPALKAVRREIERAGVDGIVNLGDIASGPLWPSETVAMLMPLGWPTIAGNHERQLTAPLDRQGASDRFASHDLTPLQLDWLTTRPPTRHLPDADVLLVHGTPMSDVQEWLETVTDDLGVNGSNGVRAASGDEVRARLGSARASLVLCGHTHMPRAAAVDGLLIVNPGSVGLPAYDHDQPYAHRMETGSPHSRWAIVERGTHGWQVEFRLTAYDHEASARRAEANGRADWADALRSGRVGRSEADRAG
jgi:predicted phosphodiesterase